VQESMDEQDSFYEPAETLNEQDGQGGDNPSLVESEPQEQGASVATTNGNDMGAMPQDSGDGGGGSNKLPNGWVEATDPSSGSIYYFNQITGATQWDRPLNDEAGKNAGVDTSETSTSHDGTFKEDDLGNTSATTSAEDNCTNENDLDKSKQNDSMNETAVSTARSSAEEMEGEESTLTKNTSNARANDDPATTTLSALSPSSTTSAPATLPEGWIEATDPTSGNVYYYNQKSGMSTWERPTR